MTIMARRPDIDWVRVLAVLLLVPFHVARIFNIGEPFYAKNADPSPQLSLFIKAVEPWRMPLLFVLAGASTYFALGQRTGAQYLLERVQRLLVPLAFGVLIIVPPQGYTPCSRIKRIPAACSRTIRVSSRSKGDLTGYFGDFTPGHLWFILFLVVFSVVALPLFVQWASTAGRGFPARLASACQTPGALFLLAIPLAIAAALPDVGGKNPFLTARYSSTDIFGSSSRGSSERSTVTRGGRSDWAPSPVPIKFVTIVVASVVGCSADRPHEAHPSAARG